MIRTLLTACILVLLLLPTTASAGPRFGVEAGVSSVWLSDAFEYVGRKPSWRLDFNGAATAKFDLKGDWSLAAGLRYSRLGNEFEIVDFVPASDPTAEAKAATVTNLHQYVGVPVVFQFDVPGDKVFILGGTEVAYLVKGASEAEYDDGSGSPGSVEYTEDMNRFNMTLIMGIGFDVAVGEHAWEIAFRYAHGLIQTNDNELSLGWKTRELTMTVGFRL